MNSLFDLPHMVPGMCAVEAAPLLYVQRAKQALVQHDGAVRVRLDAVERAVHGRQGGAEASDQLVSACRWLLICRRLHSLRRRPSLREVAQVTDQPLQGPLKECWSRFERAAFLQAVFDACDGHAPGGGEVFDYLLRTPPCRVSGGMAADLFRGAAG